MSKIGTRLIKAAKEARAIARGQITDGFVVHVPDDFDVKALRKKLKCSQSEFSRRFGFAIDAVQDWEQHRRNAGQKGSHFSDRHRARARGGQARPGTMIDH